MNNHYNVVKLLINRGAIVNAHKLDGWSSLHLAVCSYSSSIDTVKLLLLNGNANVNAINKYSQTPLDVLLRSSSGENHTKDQICKFLLDNGAVLNADINPKHKPDNYFMILNIISSYYTTHNTFLNENIEYLPWKQQLLSQFYPIPNSLIPKCGWLKAKEITRAYHENEIIFNLHLHIANTYSKKDSDNNIRMYLAKVSNKTYTILEILKYFIPQYI